MRRDADDLTRWTGSMAAVANCVQGDGGGSIDLEFTCNDTAPIDPTDCTQVFAWTIEGNSITEENCCCFDSDPTHAQVEQGEFCLVGGFSPLWTGARVGDGTGCNCATWEAADALDGTIPIIWAYETDIYGGACCQPDPCPDDCCPGNPCGWTFASTASGFREHATESLPKDVAEWLSEATTG
jgi:hypothetical protein